MTLCTCGHGDVDHKSSRPMNVLAPILRGVCLVPGCKCWEFAAASMRKQP